MITSLSETTACEEKKKGWEVVLRRTWHSSCVSGLCRHAIGLSCRYLLWNLPSGRGLSRKSEADIPSHSPRPQITSHPQRGGKKATKRYVATYLQCLYSSNPAKSFLSLEDSIKQGDKHFSVAEGEEKKKKKKAGARAPCLPSLSPAAGQWWNGCLARGRNQHLALSLSPTHPALHACSQQTRGCRERQSAAY